MVEFFLATTILLLLALIVAVFYVLKLGKILIEVEDAVTSSLDVCDQSYNNISNIIALPIAVDSIEIRQIMIDLTRVRDSILYISNVIAGPFSAVDDEVISDDAK